MLYELAPILDIPEYEGFAWLDRRDSCRGLPSLTMDFRPQRNSESAVASPVPLSSLWSPKKVVGDVRTWNDFPAVNLNIPAFSARAVDVLRDLLEPNGELLPLVSEAGQYYAYHVMTVADVLDIAHCEVTWGLDKTYASRIRHFECYPDSLDGQKIFRLPQQLLNYFVTEEFAQRVREYRLQGFNLSRVWPLPSGDDWWDTMKARVKRWQMLAATYRREHGDDFRGPPLEPWRDI